MVSSIFRFLKGILIAFCQVVYVALLPWFVTFMILGLGYNLIPDWGKHIPGEGWQILIVLFLGLGLLMGFLERGRKYTLWPLLLYAGGASALIAALLVPAAFVVRVFFGSVCGGFCDPGAWFVLLALLAADFVVLSFVAAEWVDSSPLGIT